MSTVRDRNTCTAGCRTCRPAYIPGKILTTPTLVNGPATTMSSSPSSIRASGAIWMPPPKTDELATATTVPADSQTASSSVTL